MTNTTNYGLQKPDTGEYYSVNVANENMDIIDEKLKENADSSSNAKKTADNHISNKENPHNVTASDVGLGNVPNVSTNNQTPTYTESTELVALTNGEKLSIAFGKIAKAISSVISHLANKSNPHSVTKTQLGLGNVDNKSSETIRSEITSNNVTSALGYTPLNAGLKGANSGVAELDANGKVPSSQLPSYVDDVLEYSSKSAFPSTGESGKIYIATDTNLQYRWSGSAYAEISPSLALGETSSTAYRGDKGATAYTHSQTKSGNPHNVTKSDVGLGSVPNVATNDQTPTYSDTSTFATLTSGEKLSVAFAKIKLAITNLINHVSNYNNPHNVTKTHVGLGNCDNTSDANKPISNATASALAGKAPTSHASTDTTYGQGNTTNYGHVKLSDAYTSSGGNASDGVGASSQAVVNAWNNLNTNKAKMVYGYCAGYSAGVAGTKAFSGITRGVFLCADSSTTASDITNATIFMVYNETTIKAVSKTGSSNISASISNGTVTFSSGYSGFYIVGIVI